MSPRGSTAGMNARVLKRPREVKKMPEPIGFPNVSQLLQNPAVGRTKLLNPQQQNEGADFKSTLLDSLDEVNRLQMDAAKGIEKLSLGETANMAEIFLAVRKADIAFSMMMEMRNKLVEAYRELQQMRI